MTQAAIDVISKADFDPRSTEHGFTPWRFKKKIEDRFK